jgi:hypothetical protein
MGRNRTRQAVASVSKQRLEQWLAPIGLLAALVGIFVNAVEAVTKVMSVWAGQYYVTVTVMWIAVVALAVRVPRGRPSDHLLASKTLRNVIITLGTLGWLLAIGWPYYEHHWRDDGGPYDPRRSGSGIGIFATVAGAETLPARAFTIEVFRLDDDLCSFREDQRGLFGQRPRSYRTFEFNSAVNEALSRGKCFGARGERPVRDAWRLLRHQMEQRGQRQDLPYLEKPEDLSRLLRTRGDVVERLMFTDAELRALRKNSEEDFRAVLEWLVNCVGVHQPVLTFVIRSHSAEPILLTKIVYDVQQVGEVRGADSGPLYPIAVFDHEIRHEVGQQAHALNPALQIEPHDRITFSVRLYPSEWEPGLAWLMRIRILDSTGAVADTEPFQLIMSKGISARP